ncbi:MULTISPECIES: flavin reductase family protein [Prauserella salsuginis group]|uniref:Flavin reductase family protein n=1 Tax=Prauserella salsuginis TaxID=387889 RepID=A0ABW6G160_9PSEU|nr:MULTISPECIES: flavin reductase family protein [Prauserella salsuginis group]MCR3722090.1 NADH-FMN oxidoreductase RutF, flavin reductase (DIM6/NTAB) family [Prauserella flava]MCR3736087.1 NADH-FMN oxidoreductase RutF, flavin reductase (DIM6/NTAB) family [Prauserella salsuginis]
MDPKTLRTAFGRFATGVTVITCRSNDGEPHGATVTAFMPVSLDPPLITVALTRTSRACSYLDGAPFAVNVLAADQVDVAMNFAGRPSADPIRWAPGPTAPVLAGTAATLSCTPQRTDDGGDHLLFLGEVAAVETTARPPLLFSDSTFAEVGAPASESVWTGSFDDPHSGWFDAACDFTPISARPASTVAGTTPHGRP